MNVRISMLISQSFSWSCSMHIMSIYKRSEQLPLIKVHCISQVASNAKSLCLTLAMYKKSEHLELSWLCSAVEKILHERRKILQCLIYYWAVLMKRAAPQRLISVARLGSLYAIEKPQTIFNTTLDLQLDILNSKFYQSFQEDRKPR